MALGFPARWSLALGLSLGLFGTTAAHADGGAVTLPFTKYVLANGLEVILHEDHRTPVVAVNVWYHVGSKDEEKGKNGFAHLFEHVMFQGSKHVGEDQYFKYLERAGASDRNGTTNTDRTNYFETVPANQLEVALWLESDRMGFLLDHVDQTTFASQREVVKNERRQNYENAPYGRTWELISAALYPEGHPYHLLTIGSPEDLDRATLDDVKAFFRRYYVPNNATLSIAGDIKPEEAKAMIEKYFGPIVKGDDARSIKEAPAVKLTSEKRLAIEASVELPRVTIVWPTPKLFAPGDADLDVTSDVLAGGKSSRLYKRLVHDLRVAQDVSASQGSSDLGSAFFITATLNPGKSADEAIKAIDEELAKLRAAAPSADEVDRSRTGILSQMIFGTEKATAKADRLNHYNQSAGDPGFFEKDAARYRAITPEAVKAAVTTFLPADGRVVAIVTPNAQAPRAGRLVEAK